MGPLVIAALAGGAFYLYEKVLKKSVINQSNVPVAQTSFAKDPQTGTQFAAQPASNGTIDVFLFPAGTRIVRFDPGTRTEIISPPGTDPSIKAAAMRAFGIIPKG